MAAIPERYRRQAYILATMIALLIGVTLVINRYQGDDRGSALVERSCEIVRDIARDAAAGVDTMSRTRDRLEHLLDGYGVNAPADIRTPLRDAVAATTDVTLETSMERLGSACSARGL
jgi:hypothetical protein